jgi:RNA polymerase sigma-70 factor (ECF subfamily)
VDTTETQPSDAELVSAILAGRPERYSVLVDRHLPQVYSVAYRILNHRADAEDIAQDTFVRAYERLSLYDPAYSFRNWLLKMASNLAINRIRSRKRERKLHLKLMDEEPDEPEDTTDKLPTSGQWTSWLAQLESKQRAAIVLFHFHGMPYAEVAEILEVPVNTVRTYLHRGRRKLRAIMSTDVSGDNVPWNVATQNG